MFREELLQEIFFNFPTSFNVANFLLVHSTESYQLSLGFIKMGITMSIVESVFLGGQGGPGRASYAG
jgi:hypothetical protein